MTGTVVVRRLGAKSKDETEISDRTDDDGWGSG